MDACLLNVKGRKREEEVAEGCAAVYITLAFGCLLADPATKVRKGKVHWRQPSSVGRAGDLR